MNIQWVLADDLTLDPTTDVMVVHSGVPGKLGGHIILTMLFAMICKKHKS